MVKRNKGAARVAVAVMVCGMLVGVRAQSYNPEGARFMAARGYLLDDEGPGA